jgi:cation transport regulator ChaC
MARVWYFAYGSNMQSATLRGRRGIGWARALPARVAGWRFVCDKPPLLTAMGEGFANLVPESGAEVYGVLFELEAEDLAHVELTEGVPIGNYRRLEVLAEPLGGTEAVTASTLVTDARDAALVPSERYRALLVDGAREHRLPAEWIAFLESLPARPETAEASRLRPLLDAAMVTRAR